MIHSKLLCGNNLAKVFCSSLKHKKIKRNNNKMQTIFNKHLQNFKMLEMIDMFTKTDLKLSVFRRN